MSASISDQGRPAPESLQEILEPLKRMLHVALGRYLSVVDSQVPARLREAMTYSVDAGGKRLRPLLTLLACQACGGDPTQALPAACALELVHTYSLVHDDLPAMDDDDLRRGQPTNHVVFGEAMAILAGDALLTRAFEIVALEIQPPAVAAACCADLASAAGWAGMVGGQVVDLEAETGGDRTLEHLESIHIRKTGRLLSCALSMGARIAAASEELRNRLIQYGNSVGLAFQITDDLLDVAGDQGKMGKELRKDAEANKLTYPGLIGISQSRERVASLLAVARGAIEPLGESARGLRLLADFIGERDH